MIFSTKIPRSLPFRVALPATAAMLLIAAVPCRACFSIVVGKSAAVDGRVLVAHNEDDTPPQVVNHHKVPRRTHERGEVVCLGNGGQLAQVPETWCYLWSEMPGMPFSDSYVNEWGVCVTSDSCPSREEQGELTDGGIGSLLRRLVAERARSAREGVGIAGELVERFGYVASGRTYVIADPEEGWLFCAIQGKHWLARRVGDHEVAMVANTFTVREADLSDTSNVVASKDILAYATQRGWYDASQDGAFDFAAAYADPKASAQPVNYGRQSIGLRYVTVNPLAIGNTPPFSVVPSKRLGVADLIRILRHNGGDSILAVDGTQVSCDTSQAICRGSTQTSFVAKLGTVSSHYPGTVYWTCLSAPATSVFIPFHFGITDFPAEFRAETERPTQALFDRKVTSPFVPDRSQAFWTFSNFRIKARSMSDTAKAQLVSRCEAIESRAMKMQQPIEKRARKLAETDRAAAAELLSDFSNGIYLDSLEMLAEILPESTTSPIRNLP